MADEPRHGGSDKQAKLGKDELEAGWVLDHAENPSAVQHGGTAIQLRPGNYTASKRVGIGRIEQGAESLDGLKFQIAEWERAQPLSDAEIAEKDANIPPEQALASGIATLHQGISAGARQAAEVYLTPVASPGARTPEARIESSPDIQVKALNADGDVADDEPIAEGTVKEATDDAKKAAAKAQKTAKKDS